MPLVPGSLRRPAMVLLAACVAAIAVTGARFGGYGLPGWLDATFDPRFEAQQGRFPVLLHWLPHLGGLKAVTVMTFALLLACAITRRWRGAVLTALAVPLAIGLTEYVLKPTVGEATGAAFPSGHATSSFALAASFAVLLANPPFRVPAGLRLLLVLLAVLMATAVAAAMVAIGAHSFSDAVGGAAVGVGVVLACALTLDALGSLLRPEPAAGDAVPGYPVPVAIVAQHGPDQVGVAPSTPTTSTCPGRVKPEGSTMSSSPESPHLDNHHRNTLRQIFEHPVSHNIEWHAVTSLFDAIGTVTVHGGKVTITVGAERQIFDHPVGKDVDAQMVVDLRHMLTAAGYTPS